MLNMLTSRSSLYNQDNDYMQPEYFNEQEEVPCAFMFDGEASPFHFGPTLPEGVKVGEDNFPTFRCQDIFEDSNSFEDLAMKVDGFAQSELYPDCKAQKPNSQFDKLSSNDDKYGLRRTDNNLKIDTPSKVNPRMAEVTHDSPDLLGRKIQTATTEAFSRRNLDSDVSKESDSSPKNDDSTKLRKNRNKIDLILDDESDEYFLKPSLNNEGKKTKSLALRADVMNKNFVRAFRRHCKSVYLDFLKQEGRANSRSKRTFKTNMKKFMLFLSGESGMQLADNPEVNQEEFIKYLSIFVNTCMVKKKLETPDYQTKVQEINELLYTYSHKKFECFFSIPEVSMIVNMMFTLGSVEEFISSKSSLSSNTKEYTKHIRGILKTLSY